MTAGCTEEGSPTSPSSFLARIDFPEKDSLYSSRACRGDFGKLEPVDYYGADEDSYAQLEPAELRAALHRRISKSRRLSYGCLWKVLAQTDPGKRNGTVKAFYTGREIPVARRDRGKSDGDAWNREHLWPKVRGIKSASRPAHNDAHHVRPADKSVNAERGHKLFAVGGSTVNECNHCLQTTTTFQPPIALRGDIARALLYMDLRYAGDDGPDLALVSGRGNADERMAGLCLMLQWHSADPVSAAERVRNDVVYRYQGNRNPVVDMPALVKRLWRADC